MEYIERPTIKAGYTKQDLTNYAFYRKRKEIEDAKMLFGDKDIKEGHKSVWEHEDYREPLSIAKQIVAEVLLSTGGDADGFKFTFDDEKNLLYGVYFWSDWGAYEEVALSDNELELIDRLYCVSDWVMGI